MLSFWSEPAEAARAKSARLLLLSKFLTSTSFSQIASNQWYVDAWSSALKEPPSQTVSSLLAEGYLVRPTLHERMSSELLLPKLKALCRDKGLKVSGKKSDLVLRLIHADERGCEVIAPLTDQYICTEFGKNAVSIYKKQAAYERQLVSEECFYLIELGEHDAASRLWDAYEKRQPLLHRTNVGFGVSASWISSSSDGAVSWKDMHSLINRSTIGIEIFASRGRGMSAPRTLLSIRTIGPHGHGTATEYETWASADSCPVCMSYDGKRYPISEAPKLPHAGCSCPDGCKCIYSPIMQSKAGDE